MQNPLFICGASLRPHRVLLQNSSFAPTHNLFPLCSRPVPVSPTMLLGIPRLFGRTGRPKVSETIETVEVAPPPSFREKPLVWAKAHPFQVAAVASLMISVAQRAINARKKSSEPSLTTKVTSSANSTSAPSSRMRAVPKKHETTEEALDLLENTARKYIIVGGKGGVGKTSMSAAVATSFADRGQTTLIVSTDPAHSLSDAFGQTVSGGAPVPVLGIDNLYAQEVDPETMKKTFKMTDSLSGMGMEEMGLDDLNSLFDTIPPGFDEAVALVEIIKYIQADAEYSRFERIVFDTAPTGHTLRLLALPDFLNGFFGKIISMKSKFGNLLNQFKGMFGNDVDMNDSMEDMEEMKRSMRMVRELFRDEIQTEFVVATIPNMMAIAESTRLVEELRKEKIPVRHLFVNQVQPANDDCMFCAARRKEQSGNMRYLQREFEGLQISTVQSFDKEIKGAGALRAMGEQLFPHSRDEGGDGGKERTKADDKRVEETSSTSRVEAELIE